MPSPRRTSAAAALFRSPLVGGGDGGESYPRPGTQAKSSVSLRPRGDGRPDGNRRPWRIHSARRDDVRPRPPRTPTRGKRDSDEDSPPSRFRAGDRARRNRPPTRRPPCHITSTARPPSPTGGSTCVTSTSSQQHQAPPPSY